MRTTSRKKINATKKLLIATEKNETATTKGQMRDATSKIE